MSENSKRGLQRVDMNEKLPVGFDELSKEEQEIVRKRIIDQEVEIKGEMLRRVGKSQIAEHDLAVGIDAVQRLDHERKIYSQHIEGETGSGNFDVRIRGGDTKFIVPVLVVLGVIVLGIVLILSMR